MALGVLRIVLGLFTMTSEKLWTRIKFGYGGLEAFDF
jgi:hypothetical protein